MLMMDFDEFRGFASKDANDESNPAGENVTLTKLEYDRMMTNLRQLRIQVEEHDGRVESYQEILERMRDQKLEDFEKVEARVDSETEARNNIDKQYANSYAHFGIHHEMLSDRVRTLAYKDAIEKNAESTILDKTVLDLGCGTAILSMFCARAGAKSVVGVDMSSIVHQAMDIVRENGLESKINLKHGRLEDLDLDGVKFDVIVSEWMGYFLLYEAMLDSVISARKRFLKPGGRVLPNRCTMHLVGVSDTERAKDLVDFWDDVYGFKMSCMRTPSLVEASVEVVPSSAVVTESVLIHTLDMETCELSDTEFASNFEFIVNKDSNLTAVAGYFDAFFDLSDIGVSFTTGPTATPTHWKQTVFHLSEKIKVSQGQHIEGRISVRKLKRDVRGLSVALTLADRTNEYTIE